MNNKKIILLIILAMSLTCLYSRWLYLDAGVSGGYMRINLVEPNSSNPNEVMINDSYHYFTGPNLNFRLGVRPFRRLVLVADYQTFNFEDSLFYTTRTGVLRPSVEDFRMDVSMRGYVGGGFIVYPYRDIQCGLTIGSLRGGLLSETIADDGRTRLGSPSGIGISMSVAYEFQINNINLIVGSKYFRGTFLHIN